MFKKKLIQPLQHNLPQQLCGNYVWNTGKCTLRSFSKKLSTISIKKNSSCWIPAALHLLWPGDSKHIHELLAVSLGMVTQAPAGQRHPSVLHTHGGIQGTQERPEVWRALQVHHGVEGLLRRENRELVHAKCPESLWQIL